MPTSRQKLPPQITKGTDKLGTFWQLRMSFGPRDDRSQINRKLRTEKEALDIYTELIGQKARGITAATNRATVEKATADYLANKRLKGTSEAALEYSLQPLRDAYPDKLLVDLTKTDLNKLVTELLQGKAKRADGSKRKHWPKRGHTYLNRMLGDISTMLDGYVEEGLLVRNVARLVKRLPAQKPNLKTYTEEQAQAVLDLADQERLGHCWHLALSGVRRGEIGGLRWAHIDLDAGTVALEINRVSVKGKVTEYDLKTEKSNRTLPLPDDLWRVLRAAKKRRAAEKLAAGADYQDGDYVMCDELGRPYHPDTVTDYWNDITARAGVPHIRLHDARHTCGTLLHLQNVPIAVIAAWLGHVDGSFTLKTYVNPDTDQVLALGRDAFNARKATS